MAQLTDQLGPQAQRRRSAQIQPRAARYVGTVCACALGQFDGQPGLADSGLAADGHHAARSSLCGPPRGE
jgi:hypothetical protein